MIPFELRPQGLAIALVAALSASFFVASPVAAAKGLKNRAEKHDLLIGTAVRFFHRDAETGMTSSPFHDDATYRTNLAKHFNVVTAENVMKMDAIRPTRERFDFARGDELLEFAEEHDMGVRGHTLVWHSQIPSWLANGDFSKAEMIEILEEQVKGVVEHYAGRVVIWDVVNEAVDDDGSKRKSVWSGAGKDYIERAFRAARAADPEAILCYNDYNHAGLAGWQQNKSDAVYKMLKKLVKKKVPIDCVGFQMHVFAGFDPVGIAANFERYAKLGLQVQITEMDVSVDVPASKTALKAQAKVYKEVAEICLEASNCTALVMWGFTDRYSWIPEFFPGRGAALVLNESYRKKPAYKKLNKALK